MQSWKDQPPCPSLHHPENIQHRTSNGSANPRSLRRSKFDVGRSMFSRSWGVSFRFCTCIGTRNGHDELLLHMQQKIALVETPVHGEGGSFGFDVKQEQKIVRHASTAQCLGSLRSSTRAEFPALS